MGGFGSGNRLQYATKGSTDGHPSVDVRRWARGGLLRDGVQFGWQWSRDGEKYANIQVLPRSHSVSLMYRSRQQGGDWIDYDYQVHLLSTSCHLGGERLWFKCPAQGCGRRVAKLYCGGVFACRKCHNLSYPSQNEDKSGRAGRHLSRICNRLGWQNDGCGGVRPKGMHKRTFERLVDEYNFYENQSLGEWAALLDRLNLKLSKRH